MKTESNLLLKITRQVLLAILLLMAVGSSYATTYTWNTDTSGSYQNASNWTPGGGPPTTGDVIDFYRPTAVAVTVTMAADATAAIIYPMNPNTLTSPSNFTLDMNGYNMTTTGYSGEGNRGLSMYSSSSAGTDTLSFTIANTAGTDSTFSTTYFTVGQNASTAVTPVLTLTGAHTILQTVNYGGNTPAGVGSTIGGNSAGSMYIQNGAVWSNNGSTPVGIVVGNGAAGLLQVTGTGSAINAATSYTALDVRRVVVTIGNASGSNGALQVLNAGAVTTDDITLGRLSGSIGSITVSNAGSALTAKRIFVGGGVANGAQNGTAGGTGSLTISNGGAVTVSQSMVVYAGGTVNFTGGTLTTTGSTILGIEGGSVTGNGTIGGAGVLISNVTNGKLTASGGTITIAGGGTNDLTIGESNVAVINGILEGTVNVTGTTWVRTASTLTVDGTLGGAGAITLDGKLAGTGTISKTVTSVGNTLFSAGTLTLSGAYNINGNFASSISSGTIAANGTTTLNSSQTFHINGTLGGSGNFNLGSGTIDGSGTINKTGGTISGSGTVGGSVTTAIANGAISGGIFTNAVTANNSAISGGTYNSSLTLGNGSTWTGSRTLANALVISGTGATVSSGTLTANGTTTVNDGATLAVNGTLAGSGSLGFQSTAAAGLSGTGTISKAVTLNGNKTLSSSGTLTLGSTLGVSGAGNAISTGTVSAGATTINSGGALAVNGTLSGANGLAVNGILSGSGIINKAVTVSSTGTLSPGNSPGNLSMSSLTLAAGGNYNWQVYDATGVAGTAFDTITVSGILDLTGLSTSTKYAINLWSLSGIAPDASGNAINFNSNLTQSWTLIGAGSLSGPVGNINDYFQIFTAANNGTDGFTNTFTGAFSVGTSGNNLVLNYTAAIPEPSTYALMGIGLAALLYRSRRKSRK